MIESGIERLVRLRLSRRDALKVMAAGIATALGPGIAPAAEPARTSASTLTFSEIAHGRDAIHHVPSGYRTQVLLRWGDPILPGAPAYAPGITDADAQERQFGYDNDFIAFMPLPRGTQSVNHGLLCVNHERCAPALMWPGLPARDYAELMTAQRCAHEMAAQGLSIVEIRYQGGQWRSVPASHLNRRISARSSRIRIGGPAAGHTRMRTRADPQGTLAIGTFNNCAGGVTPWGTVLTCEENIHGYFIGNVDRHPQAAALKRYGFGRRPWYVWGRHVDRFDFDREPNEPNRHGWVVEIDPYDPASMPIKRTALGRFKHEGATAAVSHDGRVVIYMGDDERFEYLYKFVSAGRLRPGDAAANRDLLDAGTLYVARFGADGKMRWIALVHGEGPLTAANGFASQADVVIEARRAADLVGATSMDRPEDVETDPLTGRVYAVLTNNNTRRAEQVNPANPRANNRWGQIIEIVPPQTAGRADHTAVECAWEFFLIAGNPSDPQHSARYAGPVSVNGWLACPDNVAFDPRGRIWIATDGQETAAGFADSIYAADTQGPGRGITRLFFNGPRGAEICGPCFTPDARTLFVAVQHPAYEPDSTYDRPSTRWPDFRADVPPRPAVIAITRADGGEIGG